MRLPTSSAERFILPVLLGLLVVFFSVLPASSTQFASIANWRDMLATNSVVGVLALSATVTLLAGQFDFSIGLNMEFCGIAAAKTIGSSASVPSVLLALVVVLAIGTSIGVVNGLIVSRFRINPFIATLGTSTVLTGIEQLWVAGNSVSIDNSTMSNLAGTNSLWIGLPKIVFAVLAVSLIAWYLTAWTPLGRYLFAVGSNAQAARYVGIKVGRTVVISFALGGALAGLSGFLELARTGAGVPGVGSSLMLQAFAAALLGATAIRVGRSNVWGTMVAVLFVAVGTTGLVLAGTAPWVQYVFEGIALIVGVGASSAAVRTTVRRPRGFRTRWRAGAAPAGEIGAPA
jgi:ribose transport system permease protein